MNNCKIEGCLGVAKARDLCSKHHDRYLRHGDPLKTVRRPKGSGTLRSRGDCLVTVAGRHVFEHVLIAERALGKPLPPGACVHHVDENPANNNPLNLVICPDQAYHSLLHVRARALAACGNADWRKCKRCGKYDSVTRLSVYGNEAVHPECNRAHAKLYRRSA